VIERGLEADVLGAGVRRGLGGLARGGVRVVPGKVALGWLGVGVGRGAEIHAQ
jgi:hypothetical protein